MARHEFKVKDEPFLDPCYSPSNPNIDFVFVHGLNPRGRRDHAYETWTYAKGGAPWPYELLPQDFPNARIWIFGYNSNVTSRGSGASISDHANSLLNVLQRMRQEGPGDPSRIPIIFLGHSLGGLVIKQALLNAKENTRFNPTWDASFGLVFFGTPHRGGNTGALEELAVRLAKTFAKDTMDNDLMMCLKPNSLFALEAATRFSRQLNDFKILTFFETKKTNFYGLNKIVVNRDSAILFAPYEECIDLNRNHHTICKFSTRESDNYKTVRGNLQEIVSQALISVGMAQPPSSDQPHVRNERPSLGSPTAIAWSPPRTSHETIPSQSSESASQDFIGSATTIAWSPTMHSHETIPAPSDESTSQYHVSPAKIKKLNAQFLTAVKELDTFLIYKWIKDFSGRPILDTDHVQSALLALTSIREPEKASFRREAEEYRVHAVSAILTNKVVSLECRDDDHKMTPLIFAACFGRKDITKLLIDNGASLRAKDGKYERNALSWAAKNNFFETAKVILQASLDKQDGQAIESKDRDHCTALDLARQRGHTRIVELLESRAEAIGELEAPVHETLSWAT